MNLQNMLDEGFRGSEMVGRPGLDHGEKQRLMARAAGRMVGGGPETSAASDVTPRATGSVESLKAQPERASNTAKS